jgi:hypothetical protein
MAYSETYRIHHQLNKNKTALYSKDDIEQQYNQINDNNEKNINLFSRVFTVLQRSFGLTNKAESVIDTMNNVNETFCLTNESNTINTNSQNNSIIRSEASL